MALLTLFILIFPYLSTDTTYSHGFINTIHIDFPLRINRYYLQPWLKALRVGFGSIIVLANIATFIMLLRARTLQLALRLFLLNVAVVDCGYGAGFLYHSAIGQ